MNVVYNLSALGNYFGHLTELVVHKHQVGDGLCGVGTAADGNCAVGLAHCQNIVYAVPRHCDGMSRLLHRTHQNRLLLGSYAPEHCILIGSLGNLLVGHSVERYVLICVPYAHLARYYRYGQGIVAADNLDVDVVFLKPTDNFGSVLADSILQRDDCYRLQSVRSAVCGNRLFAASYRQHAQSLL